MSEIKNVLNLKRFFYVSVVVFLLTSMGCAPRMEPFLTLDMTQMSAFAKEPVRDVQFSHDGKKLLVLFGEPGVSDQGTQMYVWDLFKEENNSFLGAGIGVSSASWSPDGRWIASAGIDSAKVIHLFIWDPTQSKTPLMQGYIVEKTPTQVEVNRVFFSPTNRFVAVEYVVDKVPTTAMWEITAGNVLFEPVLKEPVRGGIFHAGGLLAISGLQNQQPGPIKFFQQLVPSLKGAWAFQAGASVYATKLLSVADRGVLAWLDSAMGEDQLCYFSGSSLEIAQKECPRYGKLEGWYPSADGTALLLVKGPQNSDGTSRLFFIPDASAPARSIDLGEKLAGHDVLLSPASTHYLRIEQVTDGSLLQLLDSRTGSDAIQLGVWPAGLTTPWVFSPSGTRLAGILNGKEIYLWDVSGL